MVHSLEGASHLADWPANPSIKGKPVADTAINPLVVSKGEMGVRDTEQNIRVAIIKPTI